MRVPDAARGMADRTFFWLSAALFAAILLPSLFIPVYLTGSSAGLKVFYDWADMLVSGAAPLLASSGQHAPVVRLSVDEWVPVPLVSGMCGLASAILILRIGWKAYGREAGLVAGALFSATIALPLGSLMAEEALALSLLLASAYLLFCRKYLASGLCVGLSAWLEPYAAILLFACMYVAYREGGAKVAIRPAAGFILASPLLALALIPGAAGALAGGASLISLASYNPDALISAAGMSVSLAMLTSLLPVALLGLARRRASVTDWYFLISALAFASTLLVRQYLSYWALALPFIALLCAGQWAKEPDSLK